MAVKEERLGTGTQEALLGLLLFDDFHGAQVAAQLDPSLFSGLHNDIAEAVFQYRRKYKGKAPGKSNLTLLIERLPVQDEKLKAIRTMLAGLDKKVERYNKEEVVNSGVIFAKRQNFLKGILKAAEQVSAETADLAEVEKTLHETLRYQPTVRTTGIRLSDIDKTLNYRKLNEEGYSMEISSYFDDIGINLRPKTLTVYLAGKNTGKSWWCVHLARQCLLQGANVVYITLEMSGDKVVQRMHQNWGGISVRNVERPKTVLKIDKFNRASGWRVTKPIAPRMHMDHPNFEDYILGLTAKWALKMDRCFIQEYPTGSMSIQDIENYLDVLAETEGFQPHVLIVDYPDLMKLNRTNYRHDLGAIYIALRGLATSRNLAVAAPSQVNRIGMDAAKVKGTHIAEDVSKLFTADQVLAYAQTPDERKYNLARLSVAYARDTEIGGEVLISQNYGIGQYVLGSAPMGDKYRAKIAGEAEKSGAPVTEADVEDERGIV